MKDFDDVWVCSQHLDFNADTLPKAIDATFTNRETPVPTEEFEVLSTNFVEAHGVQWNGFVKKMGGARVPASEFQREFGRLRSIAHREAVIVTSHGRDDVVLLSAEEYRRLRSLDRRSMHVSELTDEEIAALDSVEIPTEAARYNHEMT